MLISEGCQSKPQHPHAEAISARVKMASMAIPNWYWPPARAAARGVSLVPFGAGVAVADWTTPTVWPFAGSAFTSGIVLASGTPGLCGAASDGVSGGLWALAYSGGLFHVTSGRVVAAPVVFPSGRVYVGVGVDTSGNAYGVAASGDYYRWNGSTTTSGTFGNPAWFAQTDANYLYTLQAAVSGIGQIPFSGGGSGLIAYPAAMPRVSAFTTSGSVIGAVGWAAAPVLSGMAASVLDPQVDTNLIGVGSGFATLLQAPNRYSNAWAQTQALTGLTNLSAMAWRPDGTQVLAASVASGSVQVIGFSLGTMTLAQTLAVSGACSVAVAADSGHALVAQSGQAQLATLAFTSTWATGTPVTGLPGIVSVLPFGLSGAVAAYTSGLAFLQILAGTWTIQSTLSVGFTPRVMTIDPFSTIYVAGSGVVAAVAGGTVVGSGIWAGAAPTGIAVQEGRVLLAVPSDNSLYIYGQNGPTQQTITNALRNSTMVGAVPPSTQPTNWDPGAAAGLTVTIVGTGVESSLSYVDVRFAGTTNTTSFGYALDTTTGIPAVQNQTWTFAPYTRLMAGGWTNVSSVAMRLRSFSSVPTALSTNDVIVANPSTAPLATQRTAQTWTIPDATAASIRPILVFNFLSGVAVDFTIRIGAPQVERGAIAHTWVPTSGTAASGIVYSDAWALERTYALAQGPQVGLALAESTLFSMGSGSTVTYSFSGSPFEIIRVKSGIAGIWNGSWTTADLGIGHMPSAAGFDASGNLYVASSDNFLWSVSPAGTVLTSGLVAPYSGQVANVTLSLSDLIVSGGNALMTTSLPGAFAVMAVP